MATFVSCNFTDSAGTDLNAHTPEGTGDTWTRNTVVSSNPAVVTAAGRARANIAGGAAADAIYYASGTPATNEYDVECDIVQRTSIAVAVGVYGRLSTTQNTGYCAFHNGSGNTWTLGRFANGTFTSLGTFAQTLTNDQAYHLKLEIRTATKKVYIDGVERISSTDDTLTTTGLAGIRLRGSNTTTDSAGTHIDAFTAADPSGTSITGTGAVTIGAPSLAGSGTSIPPAITGTGAVMIGAPALAGSGTYGTTGTGGVTIGAPALAGSGTYTPPAITGTGAVTIERPSLFGHDLVLGSGGGRHRGGFALISRFGLFGRARSGGGGVTQRQVDALLASDLDFSDLANSGLIGAL